MKIKILAGCMLALCFLGLTACVEPSGRIENEDYTVGDQTTPHTKYVDPNVKNVEPVETEEKIEPEDEGKVIFHMSTYGDDATAEGTFEKPFATFSAMKAHFNSVKAGLEGDVVIYVRGGTYFSRDAINFTTADNYAGGTVTYKAYPGHNPSVSGGTVLDGEWTQVTGMDGVWKTSLVGIDPVTDIHGTYNHNDKLYVREFYANNRWQKRSTTEDWLNKNNPTSSKFFDENGDGTSDGILIRQEINQCVPEGLFAKNPDGSLKNNHMEASFITTWRNYRIAITDGDAYEENARNYFSFTLDSRHLSALIGMTPVDQALSPANAFTVENALTLVDTETEWYYDVDTKELYWYPEEGVDPNEAYCVIPTSEKLLDFSGNSPEDRVSGFGFDGIFFENSTLLDVSNAAYYGYQSIFLVQPYRLEHGAIEMNYADKISFENCTFRNLSSSAVCLYDSNRNITFDGNLFYDIGGSGINYGYNDQLSDVSQPVSAANDLKVNADIEITNNAFTRTEIEYWGLCAIQGIYGNRITIEHNFFDDLKAYAVAVGWGWDTTRYEMHEINVCYNYFRNVEQIMHDGAAVYTLGRAVDSNISYNYIDNVNVAYGALYCDDGSHDWKLEYNVIVNCNMAFHFWTPSITDILVRNNFANTQEGTYNQNERSSVELPWLIEEDALPPLAVQVKKQAGPQGYDELVLRLMNLAYGINA